MTKLDLTFDDLNKRYEEFTARAVCECSFATELVGGQPADDNGLRAFVTHHLKIADAQEAEKAVARIKREEIGERALEPGEGELNEKRVYGVNVLRRDEHGPYLGDWMVKACLKAAASRVGVFVQQRGSKGDFSEAGRVRAYGPSILNGATGNLLYLRGPDGESAESYFKEFMGRVQSPQGPVSVVHHSECVPPGTRFGFEFRFKPEHVRMEDVKDVLALAMIVGLGSVKALERGKFRIEKCSIEFPDRPKKKDKSAE